MKLLDVNMVVAAHRTDHPQHDVVGSWFAALTSGDEQFWVPDTVWASFVRISTNRRIFAVPTPLDAAFAFLRAVREQPNHVNLAPTDHHLALFETLCQDGDAPGDLAAHAYLAALALDHGCELVSLDRDFARFSGLSWVRPGDPVAP
ncbi:MAG: type II toxin-antitoxin system VapC family toxin [Acidimicrobiales bacterium]